jgi:hypothetical protein
MPQGTHKAAQVLAVSAIFCASFYAGRRSYGVSAPFAHQDIVDAQESCGEGKFIGGCHQCSDCSSFEVRLAVPPVHSAAATRPLVSLLAPA